MRSFMCLQVFQPGVRFVAAWKLVIEICEYEYTRVLVRFSVFLARRSELCFVANLCTTEINRDMCI
jgi:hypothetical protein